jgi:hypothetical protein|tara:strand:- start:38 stop:319 length:282 start_codon:yes stop_codon:yes gene_type:complete
MNRYAHVENGVVTNVSIWDGETSYNPPDGVTMILADGNTRIGGTYDGEFHYVEPPIPEPTAEQVAKQAKLDSVKSKLEALGLTTEEVREAFGL